ncbi:MAG: DUF2974 domain-containing protein [Peptococcaceae bacterium]|nr:DUF2974 domain-containing protein [Peptococcaceae bacterium]
MVDVQSLQEQSAIIDLIVYSGFSPENKYETPTIKDILDNTEQSKLDSELSHKWDIVKRYADNHPDFQNIQLIDHSIHAPMDATGETYNPDAFLAMTFYDPANNQYTVAYSGTPKHAWVENANAFGPARDNTYYTYDVTGVASETVIHEHASQSQSFALNYLNYVKSKEGLTKDDFIITTGHSQGDNSAKTAAIKSDLDIDLCFGFDGQGYSPETLAELSQYPNFQRQCSRIHQLRADNNVIDAFGYKIEVAPPENITYIEGNFSRGRPWPIDHVFSIFNDNYREGESIFNDQVEGRGILSNFAASYSELLLLLPPEVRVVVGRGVMQLVQLALGNGGESGFDDPAKLWEVCFSLLVSMALIPPSAVEAVMKTYDVKMDAATLFIGSVCILGFVCMFPPLALSMLLLTTSIMHLVMDAAIIIAVIGLIDYQWEQFKKVYYVSTEFALKLSLIVADLSVQLQIKFDRYNNAPGYHYATDNPRFNVNPMKLREMAQRAKRIQLRLDNLESELTWLNREAMATSVLEGAVAKTVSGWQNVWNLLRVKDDMLGSKTLKQTVKYLNETADEFEAVEKDLVDKFSKLHRT